MIHGGGWENGDKVKQAHFRKWAQDYARRGFVAFNINYRLAGTAKAPAAVEDAKCAVRFMHAQAEAWGLDPDRIVVTGGSAGSHLALMVGLCNDAAFESQGGWDGFSDRVAAVINRFGVTDVTDVAYGKNPRRWAQNWLPPDTPGGKSMAARLSPLSYVGRKKLPPVFSFHGAEDDIVPVEQAMRLHQALQDHGHESELVIVPFCGHGFNLNRHRELTATLEEELDRRMIAFLIRSGVILKQTKTG
jgi:acetyl esterase/lipase